MSRDTRIVRRRIGGVAGPPSSIPPLSAPATSAEYYDDDAKQMMLSVDGGPYMPYAVGAAGGNIVQIVDFNLAATVTTTAISPVYTTLMTAAIATVLAASFLQVQLYATALFLGGAGNRACAVRVRVDGVLMPISRAVTVNQVPSRIAPLAFLRRVPVVAGAHTVVVEWTRFGGGAFDTMNCSPLLRPDLDGAYLQLQEQAT